MREDRKKGLLLIDRRTLSKHADYLRRFLLLNADLTIGIITETGSRYTVQHIPPFIQVLRAQKRIIPYAHSLGSSVEAAMQPGIDVKNLNVMLLTTSHDFVKEAHQLSWGVIKVPDLQGEISRSHLRGFGKMLDEYLLDRDASNPLTLVISLDIDETIVFYEDSYRSRRSVLLNPNVLHFFKIMTELCKNRPIKIELVAVTAREQKKDERYHEINWYLSVKNIVNTFSNKLRDSDKISGAFKGDIPIYYATQKYSKLGELYGSEEQRHNTLVLHLDDNPDWTNEFDLGSFPNILYASIYSKQTCEFIFPNDQQSLTQWCEQYNVPEEVEKSEAVSSATPVLARGFFSQVAPQQSDLQMQQLLLVPTSHPGTKTASACTTCTML